jgi:hypothetical protein
VLGPDDGKKRKKQCPSVIYSRPTVGFVAGLGHIRRGGEDVDKLDVLEGCDDNCIKCSGVGQRPPCSLASARRMLSPGGILHRED